MTSLVELPGNQGRVFAVDPHRVSAVQPYEGPLRGKTGVHPLSIVWVDNHNMFVCAWPFDETMATLVAARRNDASLFLAGFAEGWLVDANVDADALASAQAAWLAYVTPKEST